MKRFTSDKLIVISVLSLVLTSTCLGSILTLTGIVSAQSSGYPISGAIVSATSNYGSGYAITDQSGYYQITETLGTGTYSVTAMKKGYIDRKLEQISVVEGQETSGVNLYLLQSGRISGKVTGPRDQPLKGILVYANKGTGSNTSSYALTGNDGSYFIDTGLSTGTYNVAAAPLPILFTILNVTGVITGYMPQSKPGINVIAPQETSGINFQLQVSGVISGKVTTTTGKPIGGAVVTASDLSGIWTGITLTANDGSYRIDPLGTGNYTVTVMYLVTVSKAGVIVTVGQETTEVNLELSLIPSGSISGRVTDTSGNPITNAGVYALDTAGHNGVAQTDSNGYYIISEGLASGNYTVGVTVTGYQSTSTTPVPVTVDQETKNINFELESKVVQSGKISGQVTVETLIPSKKTATLTLQSSTTSTTVHTSFFLNATLSVPESGTVTLYWSINGSGFDWSTTETLTDGKFSRTFGPGSPGVYAFKVVWPGDDEYESTESNSVTVTVQSMGSLAVVASSSPTTVYSGGTSTIKASITSVGTAITGATVSLASDNGGTFSTVTDQGNGTYVSTFTAPDIVTQTACAITVSASKSGYQSGSGQTQVTVQPLVLNIYLNTGDGTPISGAAIVSTSQPNDQTALSGTTDADGLARFSGILKGSYTIKASKTGYEDKTWIVTVTAGQVTTETATLSTPSEFPWFIVIAVVIVVIIAIVAFLLFVRKRK